MDICIMVITLNNLNIMGLLINGQVGWRSATVINPSQASTLWTSIYSVYNADAVGSSSLNTSLFAAYNGESNANDSFGSNNGTAVGGLTYGTGKIGNAFVGNGSNAYVSLPNNSWNFTGTFSINIWAYLSSSSTNSVLYSNYYYSVGGRDYGFLLEHQSNGNLRFYMQTSSNSPVILSTSYSGKYNSWKMITITKLQNGSLKMYIDGTSITTNNSTPDIFYNSINYTSIAAARTLGTTYGYLENNGKIDALNIWQKELTQSEITELYNSGNGAQYIGDNFYKPTTNDALNTYNGTAQGGLTYGVGKVGTAFQFNGTNAYVSLPDNSLKSILTGDFSISCWFYPVDTTNTWRTIINCYSGSGNAPHQGFELSVVGGVEPVFGIYNGYSNSELRRANTFTMNQWNHVVVTRKNGVGSKLYHNGSLVTSNTNTLNPSVSTTMSSSIGAFKFGGSVAQYQANGNKIDSLNVWSKELTSAEVTELYNSGNGKQYPN